MSDRSQLMGAIRERVLAGDGDLPGPARAAAFRRAVELANGERSDAPDLEEPLLGFVEKVAGSSYKVTDEDFEALESAGYSEDAIFGAIVATSLGAGLGRLDRGLAALRREG